MSEARIPKIAKYELTKRIGDSLLGPIFRGRHVQLSMDVSVRVLNPALAKKFPDLADRFLAAARAAGRVEHPCVARVIDCGVDNQLNFIASQWPAGAPLSDLMQTQGSLDPAQALEITRDLARGLSAAFKEGVLHRQIRPESVILTPAQPAKLTDLGLVPLNEAELEAATAGGTSPPTAHYRAPELCRDAGAADFRADIYSLGVLLYTLLAGFRPFEGASTADLMRTIIDDQPLDLKREKPQLSAAVLAVVNRMMAKDPAARYGSYDDLLAALDAALQAGRIPAPMDLPETSGPPPAPRRKGATTRQVPAGERKGTTKKTGVVSGTRRQAGVAGTGRTAAVPTGTGRQDPTDPPPPASKAPLLIIGGLVLLAVIGAVVTVVLMGQNDPPKDLDPKPSVTNPDNPIPPPPEPLPPPTMSAEDKQFFADLAEYEHQVGLKMKTGDADLEAKLTIFYDVNTKRLEAPKIRKWIDDLKTARMEVAYKAAVELSGQAKIDALDAFTLAFPDNPHKTVIATIRADTAAEVQSAAWQTAWDALVKMLGRLPGEEIDQRRAGLTDYLKIAAPQAGNPYAAMAQKKLDELETEATTRLQAALDSADRDLVYNNFEPAMDKLTQYQQRFKDSVNSPKADDKNREIAGKAFAFWEATKKAALAKLQKDVQSKSARQEVDNVIVKLKGVGTLAADAGQFSEDLKAFDDLHKRAAVNDVIPNVQNRIMPEMLHVQGKTGLSIREIDPLRIKMTEGGTPVTYMKNWTDLTLADRLKVYAYLLQPDGGEMPADIQALLDKAQKVMQP